MHIISSKIDKGKIIHVNKFKISKLIKLDELLKKTYKCQISQVKKVINKLKKVNSNTKIIKIIPCIIMVKKLEQKEIR